MASDKVNILVVDDNLSARMEAKQCVKNLGHSVMLAEDGESALHLLTQNNFDLVLLDLLMPGINGIEVLQRIQSNDHLRGMPVIIVSGTEDIEDIEQCKKAGAVGFVAKPIDSETLADALDNCLSKKHV